MVESSLPQSPGITSCGQDQQGHQEQQRHRVGHDAGPAPKLYDLLGSTPSSSSFFSSSAYSKMCPLLVSNSSVAVPLNWSSNGELFMCSHRLHEPHQPEEKRVEERMVK